MADHIDFNQMRAYDDNGDPVAGALAYFYETGTTTEVTTYADEALSTANTNPVQADGFGVFPPIFYGGTTDLKVRVTDASGVVLNG